MVFSVTCGQWLWWLSLVCTSLATNTKIKHSLALLVPLARFRNVDYRLAVAAIGWVLKSSEYSHSIMHILPQPFHLLTDQIHTKTKCARRKRLNPLLSVWVVHWAHRWPQHKCADIITFPYWRREQTACICISTMTVLTQNINILHVLWTGIKIRENPIQSLMSWYQTLVLVIYSFLCMKQMNRWVNNGKQHLVVSNVMLNYVNPQNVCITDLCNTSPTAADSTKTTGMTAISIRTIWWRPVSECVVLNDIELLIAMPESDMLSTWIWYIVPDASPSIWITFSGVLTNLTETEQCKN